MKKIAVGLALLASSNVYAADGLEKVRIGFPPAWSAVEAAIPFGDTLGFFKEEGLELEYVSVQGTAVLLPQVANGSVEFGIMSPDLSVIAAAKDEKFPIRFFYNFYPRNIFEITVLADSDIKTLADLKGKKMGVGALSWGNLPMSRLMLGDAGVTWMKDVQVMPVGVGPAAWQRMKSGSVDALNLPAPQNVMMEKDGTAIRRLPIPEEFANLFANGVATSEQLIQSNPELVERMGRAIAKSFVACATDTEKCVKAYWQVDPSSRPDAANEAKWVDTFSAVNDGTYNIIGLYDIKENFGQYNKADWEKFVQKLHEGEQISTTDFDVETLYTNRFIEGINNFDAEAVRKTVQQLPN